ncbi:MAG: penicillin-binding protein [bacterium]|nr:penicillin-binding protein [bacterium]
MTTSTAAQIVRRRRRKAERRAIVRTQRMTWALVFGGLFAALVGLPGGAAVAVSAAIYLDAAADLPPLGENPYAATAETATRLYDRTGNTLIYTLQDPITRGGGAGWIPLDTLPPYVVDAALAVENLDYLDRAGFDPLDTVLRLWQNILIAPTPPDNTITGRLARNLVASEGGSLADQRAREVALVAELERRYTPADLLEWHLNTSYYGTEAYGIEAAAQMYLGKRAVDLALDEAALLASIPTAPQYNPFDNEVAARGRQADTLRVMLNNRLISPESYEAAAARITPIQTNSAFQPPIAPEFVTMARRQAERILNDLGMDGAQRVARGGLRIVTTLDLDLYDQAECTLRAGLARANGVTAPPAPARDGSACLSAALIPPTLDYALRSDGEGAPDDGSLIVIDARTGEIRALVGTAARAAYQPGITLAPIIYLEGFNGGNSLETPATMVFDIPSQFPGSSDGLIYSVANTDGRFRGVVNLRDAMGAGLIPPAAAVAYRQGMGNILQTARQIGINGLEDARADLMLLERGGAVSLVDMAYAYAVFASGGDMRGVQVDPIGRGYRGRDPVAVARIEDADGNTLWAYDGADAARCGTFATCTNLLQEELAYIINDILADQSTRWNVIGQGSPLDTSRPTAVVNGVTADRRDNWTLGYTPDYVVGVHFGRADGAAMTLDDFGLRGAAGTWRAVIDYLHTRDGLNTPGWARPTGVIDVRVCDKSGLLPNGVCPLESEVFLDGTQPQVQDTFWQTVQINSQNGLRATANTDSQLRSDAVYFVPPEEAMDWWRANNQPLPPDEYDTVSRPDLFESIRLTFPTPFAYVGGEVALRGEIETVDLQYYQLSYGIGLDPAQWIDITGRETVYTPDAPLGIWDTAGLDGLYTVLLVAVSADNSYESEAIQVTVDNVPPALTLDTAEPGRVYRYPTDQTLTLIATPEDNLAIARVEFYRGEDYLGADEAYPFGLEWRIDGPGAETFTAVTYDQVGNAAQTSLTLTIEPDAGA